MNITVALNTQDMQCMFHSYLKPEGALAQKVEWMNQEIPNMDKSHIDIAFITV